MREIKFRAWDNHNKVIRMWDEIKSIPMLSLEINLDTPFMQFTGLHDSSGKEVYEGDIIRISKDEFGTEKDQICQIEYDGGCCYQIDSEDAGCFSLCDINMFAIFEVIGNIYENPELLEG